MNLSRCQMRKEIYEKAGDPKKLIIQKNGDHRMSNKRHQKDFVLKAALWFRNVFPTHENST